MGHVLKRKLLPQSPDCLPEEVTPYPSLSSIRSYLSILLSCLHSTLHWLGMAVLWPRGPGHAEPPAFASPPPLRSQVAFDCFKGFGLARGLEIPDGWAGLQDSRPLPLEAGQDAWCQLREHIRYRQEELPGDFMRTLQGLVKQRPLGVWGAADGLGGCALQL